MKNGRQYGLHSLVLLCVLLSACRQPGVPESTGDNPDIIEAVVPDNEILDSRFYERYNRAVGLMGQFKYSQAYQEFSELLDQTPNNIELAVNTAIARLNMAGDGDLEAALGLLKQALSKEPDHLRANYCVGLIESYMGPPAQPTEYFRLVARGAPEDADAAYLLAKSLEQDELMEEAKVEYIRSLELNPYYASSLLGLARIARMSGDLLEATRLIEQFETMKANPNGRVFEFAYRRMGRLGEVSQPQSESTKSIIPSRPTVPPGELFGSPIALDRLDALGNMSKSAEHVSMAVADIDHDGRLDLVLVTENGLACILDIGESRRLAEPHQLPWLNSQAVTAIAFGDLDHNGELDCYLSRMGENELWLQKDTQWELSSDPVVTGGSYPTVASRIYDCDHDGDLDIVCLNQDAPIRIIHNNRDGSFRLLELEESFASATRGYQHLTLGDFDNRRDTDIFLGAFDRGSSVIWNQRLWDHSLATDLPEAMSLPGTRAAVCRDIDHNGHLDLIVRRDILAEVWSWRPTGGWFKLNEIPTPSIGLDQFAMVDLNGDGQLQLLTDNVSRFIVTECNGDHRSVLELDSSRSIRCWTIAPLKPHLGYSLIFLDSQGELQIADPGPGRFDFSALSFAGAENIGESMRSNFSGIGTRWKAQIGSAWTTGQVFSPMSGGNQSMMPEIIGMQGQQQIDFVAVDWTDGVFQTELAVQSGTVTKINETQRQLASCPVVFAWNGQRIEFVTDVLGVGGIGFLVAPYQYAEARPWENLMLTPEQLQPKDDSLIVKLAEPMEEACYLHSASLQAVYLPNGWKFVVDERLGTSEPLPSGELRFFRKEYLVVSARSSISENCVDQLFQADGDAPDVGTLDHRFLGLLENEMLLEFSFEVPPQTPDSFGQHALVIDGWVEYPYSQVVFAAWQAGRSYHAPSLEFQDESGEWKSAWENFGYPAGMPRRMLLPLPKEVPYSSRFRIRSELQVYWDRIALVELEACPEAQVVELTLERAELRRAGFAKRHQFSQYRPYYDYSNRTGTWDVRHLPGFYTRLGDVTHLLCHPSHDRPLVIFGPGEEIHFEFAMCPTPVTKVPETRGNQETPHATNNTQNPQPLQTLHLEGYVLGLKGWCKDLDLYTNDGNTLEPLPFSAGANSKLELETNSRYESGPWYPYSGR